MATWAQWFKLDNFTICLSIFQQSKVIEFKPLCSSCHNKFWWHKPETWVDSPLVYKHNLENLTNLFIGDDPSPLLPPIEPGNFPTNSAGFSIYDGGITSDAESRVTDWIQQQYMKQRNNEIFNKSDESGFDAKTPEEVAKGQLISECLFDVLNFPNKQSNFLTNFCPRI